MSNESDRSPVWFSWHCCFRPTSTARFAKARGNHARTIFAKKVMDERNFGPRPRINAMLSHVLPKKIDDIFRVKSRSVLLRAGEASAASYAG